MSRLPLPLVDFERTEFGFCRTVCACYKCTQFCRSLPGYLIPADLQRIQKKIAETQNIFDWADEHLLASVGALVLYKGKAVRIPTLVPSRRPDGACIFFTEDNLCRIHAVAPFGCAFFDDHLPVAEADRRSGRGLQAIMESWQSGALYAQVWKHLYGQGLWALAPEDVRRRMDRDDRSNARPEHNPRVKKDVPTADLVELLRRLRLTEINTAPADRPALEARHGKVWDTSQLAEEFEVLGLLAPFVVVRRRADGIIGSLEFQNRPRLYFGFKSDRD